MGFINQLSLGRTILYKYVERTWEFKRSNIKLKDIPYSKAVRIFATYLRWNLTFWTCLLNLRPATQLRLGLEGSPTGPPSLAAWPSWMGPLYPGLVLMLAKQIQWAAVFVQWDFMTKTSIITNWLVVSTPLKNIIYSTGMIVPNIWENKKCSKPPII